MGLTQNSHQVLVVYAKYPQKGKVKTRLAESIGEEIATEVYSYFVHHIVKTHSQNNYLYDLAIAVSPADKITSFANRFTGAQLYIPQFDSDNLGNRLADSIQQIFAMAYRKVVIIGTDSPALRNEVITQAFVNLDATDVVLGPSIDGGYYLMGMKKPNIKLFQSIRWSTAYTLRDTIAAVKQESLKYTLLEEHFDVDDINDLKLLLATYPNMPFPQTLKQKLATVLELGCCAKFL
ncbi:TIGR04282 family arsenosugar biosynthesis glycosyltransferase [candidate division KSB1 bacterium]|nr:TIGR04282 family arsenosugar biosynthesis glycosyltransferase [candidate division KSB1 bacterium]